MVAAIEAGAAEWAMPWREMGRSGWPTNAATGNRYSGGSALYFSVVAMQHGYVSPRWATYKQWEQFGAQVRRGERAPAACSGTSAGRDDQ
ncbi:MAG: ArdC family protein [Ilumatobacteraceae bacterium]